MAARVDTQTDYASLSCEHTAASKTVVSIVGLEVVVHGLDEIQGSGLPIAAVIATHGRCNKKEHMEPFANGLLGELRKLGGGRPRRRDVIVITMDQRNHGTRLVDKQANLAYDENGRHLYDMAAMVVGGCQDVSLVMDFIAAYLFPHGERVIDEFIATGFSLGGNMTWRLLREDPRIRIAIPLLGLPFSSFLPYLRARAESMSLAFAPPLAPPPIAALLTLPVEPERYAGKRILSIHGGADALVPYARGKDDLDLIQEHVGDGMEVWVLDGVGHALVARMMPRVAEWVWRWAVQPEDGHVRGGEKESGPSRL